MASSPSQPSHSPRGATRRHRRGRVALFGLGGLVVLALGIRLALPGWIQAQVNQRLNAIPDYAGQVTDIDLSLFRGAYRLRGVEIVKRNGLVREPFFAAASIDFSLAWRELFRGRIVSDIYLEQPRLNFVQGDSAEASQVETDRRWQDVIADLFPIDITYLEIASGELRYVNTATTPRVDVRVANLHAVATGLRNRATSEVGEFPARIDARGDTLGGGRLRLTTNLEPLAEQPHFLLKTELEDVALPALNDFLRAYANVDVRAGTFKGYLEMAARDGAFSGYFKPFFENVDFRDLPDDAAKKSLGQQAWEGVVRFVTFVFKNHEKDQLATRVPFSGEFGDTQVSVWQTIVNTLRHAFVRPWPERLESRMPREGEETSAEPKREPTKAPGS